MQISLGLRGDYGIRAVLDIARHHRRGLRKTREIAQAMDIPSNYLSHILSALVRRNILIATAGPMGGYRLARPPSRIRLLDVIEAVEDPIELNRCILQGSPCSPDQPCAVHSSWLTAQNAMQRELRRTTFAQLLRQDTAVR
ncbi:MAG: Rrf2 family transcriptional regulator [Dehalococcoidia bacterium]|jgi:Rrf2 family protein|nr:Rrf2 family transcriptional regulator [Dehalococcoidia bacterium]